MSNEFCCVIGGRVLDSVIPEFQGVRQGTLENDVEAVPVGKKKGWSKETVQGRVTGLVKCANSYLSFGQIVKEGVVFRSVSMRACEIVVVGPNESSGLGVTLKDLKASRSEEFDREESKML